MEGKCLNFWKLAHEFIVCKRKSLNKLEIRKGVLKMGTLTKKQKEIIADNLRAYIANFGYIRIESNYGFYVYTSENTDSWTQYCYNIDYLNGWLYGAVQAANGIMKRIEKEC